MNKLLITKWNGQILTALTEDGKCRSLNLEPSENNGILGNIYIGKVKTIVKNINAAFVDIGNGQTGYYSLKENTNHLFSNTPLHLKELMEKQPLRPGDEIIVQVERDAVKTKAPVLTSNLNFTGKYLVLTQGKKLLGFSSKLPNNSWKEEMRRILEEKKEDSFGLIVRTNAAKAETGEILSELELLKAKREKLFSAAQSRTCYSLLMAAAPSFVSSIRDAKASSLSAIVTDDRECYEALKSYLEEHQKEDLEKLTFYEDRLLPLSKLYSLETALEQALEKHVWLKSGGYLIIEPTEALTVIDVNTGKYTGKKTPAETILKINKEAAVEIARQLQLRNLSGIIVTDFIDMDTEEDKKELLQLLEQELKKDPIKTVLVEMTKLGLVEITRKKVRRPLSEQVKAVRT